jgi:hypothetical protein
MRRPKHMRAMRGLQDSAEDMAAEGITIRKTRGPTPPNALDDLVVSYTRGQAWSRNRNE